MAAGATPPCDKSDAKVTWLFLNGDSSSLSIFSFTLLGFPVCSVCFSSPQSQHDFEVSLFFHFNLYMYLYIDPQNLKQNEHERVAFIHS